jgi:hypothetical protein
MSQSRTTKLVKNFEFESCDLEAEREEIVRDLPHTD